MRPGGVLLAPLLFAACATLNPVSGRLQLVAMSERQEERLGQRLLEQMRQSPGVLESTPLSDYVGEVGIRVASVAAPRSFAYRFFVLDSPELNALALPGGTVLITRGLLASCNDEDDLVGVLGHEVGHILARHAAARAAVELPIDLVTTAIAAAVGTLDEKRAQEMRDRLPRLLLAPYSRDQEREADRVGVVLAASLGYDPAALARLLASTASAPERVQTEVVGFATHPPTPERVTIIAILAATLERGPLARIEPSRNAFLQLLDGMLLGPSLDLPRVRGSTLIVPRDRLVLEFPEHWIHQATPDGDVAVAPAGAAVVSIKVESDVNEEPRDLRPLEPLDLPNGDRAERAWLPIAGEPAEILRIYWLEHAGTRYQLTATFAAEDESLWTPVVDGIVASAHVATEAQLAWLSVMRLRIVTARQGETLDELAARTGSVWDGVEVAHINGLDPDDTLADGELIKIALREPLGG